MGDVFIFDIDGCIMPNIFPVIEEVQNDKEIINKKIIKKAFYISVFPEFVEFYKKNCVESLAVYFLTGRKQKYFRKITESQLKPIENYKNYIIKYYPDKKPHTLKQYFNWKVNSIKQIMNQWAQDFVRFHIYDDLEDLFPFIFREISPDNRNYKCKMIQGRTDWIYKTNVKT